MIGLLTTDPGLAGARLAEMGLLRPSFVPPPQIRALRDLARTRLQLLKDRTREWQGWRSCSRAP